MPKARLDVLLTELGLAESREKAQALILAGRVTVDGQPGRKAGQSVPAEAMVEVRQPEPYVGRGGYKLAHALDRFGLPVEGRVAVDVGASTGGFTDVLLQRGARRVYAVDVGRGQLHSRIGRDPRVVVMDRTNARYIKPLPERPELAVVDVSFISLRLVILPVNRLLTPEAAMIVLVKPQFEAGREEARGGVVRSVDVHARVLHDFADWIRRQELALLGVVASPIRGARGNAEFLAWLGPDTSRAPDVAPLIVAALAEVHNTER